MRKQHAGHAVSLPQRCRFPAARETTPHRGARQFQLALEMGAIGKERRDRRPGIAAMPGKRGADGIVLVQAWSFLGFVLVKRSHGCNLLWVHSKPLNELPKMSALMFVLIMFQFALESTSQSAIASEKAPHEAGQTSVTVWLGDAGECSQMTSEQRDRTTFV